MRTKIALQNQRRRALGLFFTHAFCVSMAAQNHSAFAAAAQPAGSAAATALTQNVSLRNEVQRAIDKGLGWLEQAQSTNGWWSTPDHPAITSLALVAFSHQKGRRGGLEPDAVKNGYKFLKSCEQPDGGIYRKELPSYNTSLALMALVAGQRPESQQAILNARKFIAGLQAQFVGEDGKTNVFNGGIGYGKMDKRPDLSNTLVAMEAMKFSEAALADKGLKGDADLNWQAAAAFIERCQNLPGRNAAAWASGDAQNKGGFVYSPVESKAGETNLASGRVALRSYGSMTYAGLLSYIYADVKPGDERVTAALDWLKANYTLEENPGMGPQGLYYYYNLMTKALTASGTDTLRTPDGREINWRENVALRLINLQKADGSWANENGRWFEKDPALVTAYSLISLEMILNRL